jgi:CheY-like chemotaxis protein
MRYALMPTAIIIDDYDELADLLEHFLKLLGIKTVAKGRNGMEAFELYRAHNPDYVFLDVSMPVYDGFFALNKIRQQNPYAKIIMATGDKSEDTRRQLEIMGATDILYKPIEPNLLKNAMEQERLRLINLGVAI